MHKRKKLVSGKTKKTTMAVLNSPTAVSLNTLEEAEASLGMIQIPMQFDGSDHVSEQQISEQRNSENDYNLGEESELCYLPCQMLPVSEEEEDEVNQQPFTTSKSKREKRKLHSDLIGDNFHIAIENNIIDFNLLDQKKGSKEKTKTHRQQIVDKKLSKGLFCKCKKSHCLKSYCQCFLSNLGCNSNCVCIDCANWVQVIKPKKSKIKLTADENKIEKKVGFCQCKKTGCVKKYCECFNSGKQCGESCSCQHCQNQPIQ